MNLAHWLIRRAVRSPEAPALFSGRDLVADYGGFTRQAKAVAGWLQEQGVRPGDRVALLMRNDPAYLIVLYGVWIAGAAAVPINAKLHSREVAHILRDSAASLVFVSPDLAADGAAVPQVPVPSDLFAAICAGPSVQSPVPRAGEDLAWLFYTSGTTGTPKGVMITHGMLMAMALSYGVDVDQVSAADAALYAAPMSHGAGLYNVMHVHAGARHVCPGSGGFDPAEVLDLAAFHGRVHMFAAPTMVKRLTDHAKAEGRDGQGLRTIVYGGGPMYLADIRQAVDQFGPVFVQIYGQGECPMAITALSREDVVDRTHPKWQARLGSVGRAQSVVEVRIGDADGASLGQDQIGEIMVRGAPVMPGYWRNPEATKAALQDGWLRTGDIGVLDADGYLTLHDRSKDLIISGGSNVYPREVEEVLLQHADVVEVSVVGRPHAEWGEEVVAFVVGTADTAALDALCLAQIARFKRPKAYLRVESLPKNNYGKVLKTELRKLLAE